MIYNAHNQASYKLYTTPDCKEQQPLTRVYHLWYQWVPFYFWLSTIAFYMPYLLYKVRKNV